MKYQRKTQVIKGIGVLTVVGYTILYGIVLLFGMIYQISIRTL